MELRNGQQIRFYTVVQHAKKCPKIQNSKILYSCIYLSYFQFLISIQKFWVIWNIKFSKIIP